MVELRPHDVAHIMIGCALLAIPVSITEEAWNLGAELSFINVIYVTLPSLLLIAVFVYFNFYPFAVKGRVLNFVIRVLGTYLISLAVVAWLLTIIVTCPRGVDNALAIKRIIIVAFPAAMSGTLSDAIK